MHEMMRSSTTACFSFSISLGSASVIHVLRSCKFSPYCQTTLE
jgi:hypothetical protein